MYRLKSFFIALLVLLPLWFGFLLLSYRLGKQNKSKAEYFEVPENTEMYIRIQPGKLAKKFIKELVLNPTNESLTKKIALLFQERSDGEWMEGDLDYLPFSAIEIIRLDGLFFVRYASALKIEKSWHHTNYFSRYTFKGKNYLLIEPSKTKEIQLLNVLKNRQQRLNCKKLSWQNQDIFIVHQKNKKELSSFYGLLNGPQFEFGCLTKSSKKYTFLKPAGFHFSSELNGKTLDEELRKLPMLKTLDLAGISAFSVNYFGFEFIENDSLVGIPKMEMALYFRDNYSIESWLNSLVQQQNGSLKRNSTNLLFHNQTYFYRIDFKNNVLFLSNISKKATWQTWSQSFRIEGDLSLITKLIRPDWRGAFLKTLAIYEKLENLGNTFTISNNSSNKSLPITKFETRDEKSLLLHLIVLLGDK